MHAKTHFEQIPLAEVTKKIAEEGSKVEKSRPATAVVQNLEVVLTNKN
jgi:hypothetical protein